MRSSRKTYFESKRTLVLRGVVFQLHLCLTEANADSGIYVDSFSSVYEHGQVKSGWAFCMSKAYCKYAKPSLSICYPDNKKLVLTLDRWPAIVGIVIAIIVFALAAYCCFRCCCRGGRRSRRNRAGTASMFNPAPYMGYQPANNPNNAPPPYGEPPRFAQFDVGSRGKPVNEDSLPAMPSWENAQKKHIEDDDMEMSHLEVPQEKNPMLASGADASTADLSNSRLGYNEAGSHPVGPYGVHGAQGQPPAGYTGPDFGHGAGHPYTGPDFTSGIGQAQQTSYSAYTPSESTRYEPSGVNEPLELGTTYSNTLPPPSPSAQHTGFPPQHAPSVLQAGRRPGASTNNSWRDV